MIPHRLQHPGFEVRHFHAPAAIAGRIQAFEFRGEGAEFRLRLRDGDARLEPAHHVEELPVARKIQPREIHAEESLIERRRALGRSGDAGWKNAHNHRLHAVLGNRFPDDRRIASEPVCPNSVGQHQAGRWLFAVREQCAEQRLQTQHRHQVGRNPVDAGRFGFSVEGEDSIPLLKSRDALERSALPLPVEHVQSRTARVRQAEVRVEGSDAHEPVRIAIRQRAEQHGVHDAEDRGVRPDAQGEREHGHGGETGAFEELAKSEAKVVHRQKANIEH